MSTRALSATEWVKQLPPGGRVDWDELEAHVLRDHRQVLRLLGPAAADVRTSSRGFRLLAIIVMIPLSVIALGVVFAPIWGLATLAGDPYGVDDVDGAFAVPVAGASLLVALAVQFVLLVRIARGHPDDAGVGAGTAVLAVLVAIGIALVGARQSVDGWQWWFALAVLVAVLGVAGEIASRRRRRDAAEAPPSGPTANASTALQVPDADERITRARQLDAAISSIPPETRARLLDDRRRALEWLRLRGAISPDAAARGIGAPLGRLGEAR